MPYKNKEDARRYVKENPEKIKQYKRNYYAKHKDKIIAKNRKWEAENKERVLEYAREWRENNKEKVRAEMDARKIKIPKGQKCELCNEKRKLDKHHEDYSKPLIVMFVCRACHNKINLRRKKKDDC